VKPKVTTGDHSDQLATPIDRLFQAKIYLKNGISTEPPIHKAWNARLDADLYGQRSQSETVNSTLKRKYGAFVRSRRWWKQFRELTIACLVHNLDRSL